VEEAAVMAHEPISIGLEARTIPECQDIPDELKFMGRALQHQVDVFEAVRDHDIVLDLAPTGTGKTKAGLSALLHQPDRHAIYIAPTNALIEQQAKAAEEFIQSSQGKLKHIVKAVSAKEVRQWSNDRVGSRPGEKLYNLLRNPATIFPEIGANRPLLLVTNPDIFYYATFFSYNSKDQVNIATSFYKEFSTIIFDEFHLYDAKQLVSLLFYLTFSQVFGFFQAGRRVILLTATPEPSCEAALGILAEQGVRIKQINGETGSHQIPSQTAVNLEIRPQLKRDELLQNIADEISEWLKRFPDKYGAVILDSKDHIARLKTEYLRPMGLEHLAGWIHGSTPPEERKQSAQKQIILATSTVDVGFNFERDLAPPRQNLDWLIFSARDRAAFWQRIGRVGRVLGKSQTGVPSEAIAYLTEKAWEEGLSGLDGQGGRNALQEKLTKLKCLDRPFLQAYWQSEALLETARPLLILEDLMDNLPEAHYVPKLFNTIQQVLGGKRDWKYYQWRMRTLQAAEKIARSSPKDLAGDPLKWIKPQYRRGIVNAFLKCEAPDDWEALKNKQRTLKDFEELFRKRSDLAEMLVNFSKTLNASYAPLFQFRASLFESLHIRDPRGFLLDQADETELDPIHLLRNYEFLGTGDNIEITERAQSTYELTFHLRYYDDVENFKQTKLNKLTAFQNCRIQRSLAGALSPTPLLDQLQKEWLAGVIVSTIENQGVIMYLRKQGIASYPITIECDDGKKNYTIFAGFAGIVTAALSGIKIRLMDEEDFWVV
jgi:CRISPR-associated endonuclease/helicase Cas3